jgi:DNA polymerase III delta prime subunit
MSWSWVVGQERVVEVLRRSVAADRVAQAYLFHGPEGTGKRVAALALAQILQCERRADGEAAACGDCTPCRKVARMIHPDVNLHLALPRTHQDSPTQAQTEDVAARLQNLAPANAVVLSAVTARLVQGTFALEDLGSHMLHGVAEPMAVSRVRGLLATPSHDEEFVAAGVPFLGEVPLEVAVREGGDLGKPVVLTAPDSAAGAAFFQVANRVRELLAQPQS